MKTQRRIVRIDEAKCDGCGQCATACVEGAIEVVDGKARLISESYCDGLGACLGECPRGAIVIEERVAEEFDEEAVKHLEKAKPGHVASLQCPGSAVRSFQRKEEPGEEPTGSDSGSRLTQWPVQLALVPPEAPFLQGADLLICADCVPFAVGDFHQRYLAGRSVLVGCPKLDDIESYHEKLKEVFAAARPRSITVARMEVPCCGALARAVVKARDEACPETPVRIDIAGIRGSVAATREGGPAVVPTPLCRREGA